MKRQVLLLFTVFLSMIPILVKAQQVIDVHSHMIPQSYLDYLADNHALLDEDFPIPSWNIDEHLKFMDDASIACSILTLPAPQPWFGDSEGSAKNLEALYYDLAGAATPETIRELLTITSPSHLLYGTDYPYVKAPILIRNLSALKNNLQEIVPQDVDQVLRGNAVKLFNK